MANARNFPALVPLMDLTINSLAPNSGGQVSPITGVVGAANQATYIQVTPDVLPNNSAALPSGVVGDALIVEVTSPVVTNNGAVVYPDFSWWFFPDNSDLQKYQYFDGSYGTNMMPSRENTVGRKQVLLGISLRKLLTEAAGGGRRANMSLLATGIKFASQLAAKLASTRGWGTGVNGDVVVTPARIQVWGERYTKETLAALGNYYQGDFSRNTLRRMLEGIGPIQGQNLGQVSIDGFTQLPGGYAQNRGTQIHRQFNFASNLVQTGTQALFFLSNNPTLGGANGNVGIMNDLGWAFAPTQGNAANARDGLILQEFGVAGGIANIAFAGIQIGGTNIPDPNGWPVGAGVDRFAYGQVGPMRAESGLYYALPDLEGQIEIMGENAAIFVTANGTAIAANAATVAIGGVRVIN